MKKYILLLCSVILIHGCGGGGGGNPASNNPAQKQPTTAVVKLYTQGSLPQGTAMSGIVITVNLPAGVTVNLPAGATVTTDASGGVGSEVIIGSGETASKAVVIISDFTPATGTSPGALSIFLTSTEAAGFGVGEFATVNCGISGGSYPKATDIFTSDFRAFDLRAVAIAGLSPTFTADIE